VKGKPLKKKKISRYSSASNPCIPFQSSSSNSSAITSQRRTQCSQDLRYEGSTIDEVAERECGQKQRNELSVSETCMSEIRKKKKKTHASKEGIRQRERMSFAYYHSTDSGIIPQDELLAFEESICSEVHVS
jgi:NH3-dependent NAD+ synthetase